MSWEYSRSIPWSRIRQDGVDPETHKQQVFRELQLEAMEEEQALRLQRSEQVHSQEAGHDTAAAVEKEPIGVPFSGMDLAKQAAFGGCIGSITGAVFGFMDGMRTAGESPVLQKASNAAKGKYLLQGTTRSGALFGGFFASFHMIKYGIRIVADPGQYTESFIAGGISMGAMMVKPATRPSMPYASMLIIMDAVSMAMRDME